MDSLHFISVQESASTEIHASAARLSVRIAGPSFFTGDEAFKKATEVANLVSTLKQAGLSEEHIRLINVAAKVSSGLLKKNASAMYHLLVDCESIDLMAPVLAAIPSPATSSTLPPAPTSTNSSANRLPSTTKA